MSIHGRLSIAACALLVALCAIYATGKKARLSDERVHVETAGESSEVQDIGEQSLSQREPSDPFPPPLEAEKQLSGTLSRPSRLPDLILSGVVRHNDGLPAADANVELIGASSVAELNGDSTALLSWEAVQSATTDRSGRFDLIVPESGKYVVKASLPNGIAAVSRDISLPDASLEQGLELLLPKGGIVSGRVVMPAGGDCEGFRLWIGPNNLSPSLALESIEASAVALRSQGQFRIGPIPLGPSRGYLLLPLDVRRGFSGWYCESDSSFLELGHVSVMAAGDNHRDFYVEHPPAALTVGISIGGVSASGLGIEVYTEFDTSRFAIAGVTNTEGIFGPKPVFASKQFDVRVFDSDAGWSYNTCPSSSLTSGRLTTFNLDVELIEGVLFFVDANQNPLAQRDVAFAPIEKFSRGHVVRASRRTDALGHMALALPSGEYRAWLAGDVVDGGGKPPGHTVHWSRSGPVTSVLVF